MVQCLLLCAPCGLTFLGVVIFNYRSAGIPRIRGIVRFVERLHFRAAPELSDVEPEGKKTCVSSETLHELWYCGIRTSCPPVLSLQ